MITNLRWVSCTYCIDLLYISTKMYYVEMFNTIVLFSMYATMVLYFIQMSNFHVRFSAFDAFKWHYWNIFLKLDFVMSQVKGHSDVLRQVSPRRLWLFTGLHMFLFTCCSTIEWNKLMKLQCRLLILQPYISYIICEFHFINQKILQSMWISFNWISFHEDIFIICVSNRSTSTKDIK